MHKIARLIGIAPLLGAAAFVCAQPALAETLVRTVPANRPSIVGAFAGYNAMTCASVGIPDAKLRKLPQSGTVRIETRKEKMIGKGICDKTDQYFLVFIYTPRKGFHGKDEFSVDIPWRNYADDAAFTVLTNTYQVTVQ